MRKPALAAGVAFACASACTVARAIDVPLDARTILEALSTANASLESTRRRFHADYRFPVNRAPVDFVSVVSPFRRLVLAAESEARLGRRLFGQREALAALQPDPDRVEIYVELTFHPHNTFMTVPEYTAELRPVLARRTAVVPDDTDRLPRFGPRLDDSSYPFPYPYTAPAGGLSPGAQPLLGGTLIARFAGDRLDSRGLYDVVVKDGARELAAARVDLARIR